MDILAVLIPVSLLLGVGGLLAFWWTLKRGQYDDPEGDSRRILRGDYDDHPKAWIPASERGTRAIGPRSP